jgi:hypothetical protein
VTVLCMHNCTFQKTAALVFSPHFGYMWSASVHSSQCFLNDFCTNEPRFVFIWSNVAWEQGSVAHKMSGDVNVFLSFKVTRGARGIAVVKALCYKPEGRGFETWWGELVFSIYLFLPAALGPGVHSASNRNECQMQKNNVSGE